MRDAGRLAAGAIMGLVRGRTGGIESFFFCADEPAAPLACASRAFRTPGGAHMISRRRCRGTGTPARRIRGRGVWRQAPL